jgi:predicted DNA-binding protein
MAAEISDRVRAIAEARGLPESEVFEQALERGLEDLWEDLVLAQYLDGDLDREEAIERVGRSKVQRAEREREAVEEDVDWGLNA